MTISTGQRQTGERAILFFFPDMLNGGAVLQLRLILLALYHVRRRRRRRLGRRAVLMNDGNLSGDPRFLSLIAQPPRAGHFNISKTSLELQMKGKRKIFFPVESDYFTKLHFESV